MRKGVYKKIVGWSIILSLFSLAFYLFQVEDFIKKNYLIEKERSQIKAAEQRNSVLEEKSLGMSLLPDIEEKTKKLGFVSVSEVKYIPISVDYLAREGR